MQMLCDLLPRETGSAVCVLFLPLAKLSSLWYNLGAMRQTFSPPSLQHMLTEAWYSRAEIDPRGVILSEAKNLGFAV